jgi:hypothetical protein
MATTIRFKRGLESNLTGVALLSAEPAFTTDTIKFYIGGPDNITKYEMGNMHIPFITSAVRSNSAYWPNPQTPKQEDFIILQSYGNFIQGPVLAGNVTKWTYLANNPSSSATLKLTLCAAKFFNKPVPTSQLPQPLIVNTSNLEIGNYKGTSVFTNYVDYINTILSQNNQYTTLSATNLGSKSQNLITKRYILDNFYLEFEEVATGFPEDLGPNFRTRAFYTITTYDPNTLNDNFAFPTSTGTDDFIAYERVSLINPPNFLTVNPYGKWRKRSSSLL